MASKKSKVLAIAFCAAVMAGIHVNPVLAYSVKDTDTHVKAGAATVNQETGKVTMDLVNKGNVTVGEVTIDGLASDKELGEVEDKADQALKENQKQDERLDKVEDKIDGHTNQISSMGKELDDLEAEVGLQGGQIADLKDDVAGQGQQIGDLEVENDKQNSAIAGLGVLLEEEADARDKADDDLQDQIDGHTNQISSIGKELDDLKAKDEAQDGRLDGIDKKNEQQDNRLDNHEAVMGVSNTDGLHDAYRGTNYIKDANNMAEADVILDREISRVDGRVDRLENRVDKVGAMSAAIANLRTMGYDPAAPTEVAVGVGQYRDETGMALGLFHYPNRDFMLSLSVSTSGDEYMGGIGATWKFGRKSPEKVAEIKKAQAEADARRAEEEKLAKAEEMKKAAKEAKVQAQMERHAKMLAEQEAQA